MDYAESAPRIMELVATEAHVDGPRALLTQTYRLGNSTSSRIFLVAGGPM